jgi:hypothetical protein
MLKGHDKIVRAVQSFAIEVTVEDLARFFEVVLPHMNEV